MHVKEENMNILYQMIFSIALGLILSQKEIKQIQENNKNKSNK